MTHSTAALTRAEMEAKYGSIPLFARVWTIVNGLGTFRPTRCCERKVSYRFEP